MDADHESLELAMALHRELNAPRRRSKHKRRRKSPPRQLDPHEIAASTAVQKATKAAKSKNGGPLGRTHCKCFIAGIPWGVIIPKEALESRQSLSDAVSRAFEKDGFVCTPEELEITIVAASKAVEHFPASGSSSLLAKKRENGGGGIIPSNSMKVEEDSTKKEEENAASVKEEMEKEEDEEQLQERWAAAAQHAQRVYVSKFSKLQNK